MPGGKRKTSDVWEHFTLVSPKTAKCKYCKVHMSYCQITGSLLKHLKAKHSFLELGAASNANDKTDDHRDEPQPSKAKQQKLTAYLNTPVTPSRAKKLDDLILNVIIVELQTSNMVQGSNFKKLVNKLVPGYSIPSRQSLTRKIDARWMKGKAEMKKLLQNVKYASNTTDMWSKSKKESFLGVTMHFIDDSFELVNVVVATKQAHEEHTGDNIVTWLETILEEYEISPYQIVAIVTDNGANIVNACQKLNNKYRWIHVQCAAHTLKLC